MRADQRHLAHLVDMVYETAEQPDLWPGLLEEVMEILEQGSQQAIEPFVPSYEQNSATTAVPADKEFIEIVLPHMERAWRLSRKTAALEDERDAALGALEHVPLGVVLVDKQGTVLAANRLARSLAAGDGPLCIERGRLVCTRCKERRALAQLIRKAAKSDEKQVLANALESLRLSMSRNGERMSLQVIPARRECPTNRFAQHCAAVLIIACTAEASQISESGLISQFRLTPAEARFTKLLASGKNLSEAARIIGVSLNTVRSQLQAVFEKTATHRQAELVRLILTTPELRQATSPDPHLTRPFTSGRGNDHEHYIILKDGRRLSYTQTGDPQGFPVFLFHAIIGCRFVFPVDEEALAALGVRLITPYRPGFALSDNKPGRTVLDWADDVAELADALGISRFSVAGCSSGGPHAVACAYRLPDRVVRAALVGTAAPVRDIFTVKGMQLSHRMVVMVAIYAPLLLPGLLRRIKRGADPERLLRQLFSGASAYDSAIVNEPRMKALFCRDLLASIHNDVEAIATDMIIAGLPWGFDLAAVVPRVHVWHGDDDRFVPVSMIRQLSSIPNIRFNIVPRGGHFLLFNHWRDIFTGLLP